MKQNIYLIWIIVLISQQQIYADGWTLKADFGGVGRLYSVGFSISSKGYIGTGYDGINYKKDFWEFDHTTNVWTQKADFGGEAREGSVGFSIGTKGYIGTGQDSNFYYATFWEYNPDTNIWTQKYSISARKKAVGFSIGTKGYIGTGYANAYKKDFWEFDPTTNVWTQKADFGGTAREDAIGFSIGSKGYIGTGWDGSSKKDFWEYNPSTNVWVQRADFGGTSRYGAVGFSISSKGYIGTGNANGYKRDFWEFDPSSNTWIQKADFGGTARHFAVGFSIGTKGYIGTGLDEFYNYKKNFYEYNPACALTASITPSTTQNTCAGSILAFSGSSTGGISPTYAWSSSPSGFSSSQQNPSFTTPNVTQSTNYRLTLTVTDAGCTATATTVVTVNPTPTVNTVSNQTVSAGSTTSAINFSGSVGNATYSWTNSNPSIGLAASGTGNIPTFTGVNGGSSSQVGTITVTPVTYGYAYVANGSSNTVSLINTTTNTVINTIPVGTRPSGVSVSPDGSRVYVSNVGTDNSVSVINTATNTVVATISVGAGPFAIVTSPDGSKVYVANRAANSISVINTTTNAVISTISAGTAVEGMTISTDGTRLYLANTGGNTVTVFNTTTNAVVTNITVGSGPQGMAVSPDGSKLYVTNYNNISNSVSVINTSTNSVINTITVGTNPYGVCVSPDGSRLYVSNAGSNNVSVINTSTNAVVATVAVGAVPFGISLSTGGGFLYVSNYTSGTTSVINTSTNAVSATITVGANPISLGNFTTGFNCSGTPKNFSITVNPSGPANITQMEYFIDSDPGYGSATAVSFTAGSSVTTNFPVNLSTTTDGFHFLNLRAKDVNNNWSIVGVRPFYKENLSTISIPNITALEYFLDADPGYGLGTSIAITAGSPVSQNFTVALPNTVIDGFHYLNIRGKDINNKWSVLGIRPFYKETIPTNILPDITQMEYFIDNDTGYGNGTPITGFTQGTSVSNSFTINLGSLTNGSHKILIRGKDVNNKWSIVGIKDFIVQDNIVIIGNTPTNWCKNTSFNIPYTITGTYTTGNVFTAQLSDASGSFSSPTTLGTVTSIISGTIVGSIPNFVSVGNGYLIRVISSTPSITNSPTKAIDITALCQCLLNVSLATGNWGTAGIWSCGHVPIATEPVQISSGHAVTLDVNGAAKSLDLRGILNQQATKILTIQGN